MDSASSPHNREPRGRPRRAIRPPALQDGMLDGCFCGCFCLKVVAADALDRDDDAAR